MPELFSAYGVEIVQATGAAGESNIAFAAIIGFSGESMRGTLLLAPSRDLLERTQQSAGTSWREWAGELANQLLGRIKNRLYPYGIDLFMTTPLVIRGEHLSPSDGEDLRPYRFAGTHGEVWVWFDTEIMPGVELVLRADDGEVAHEGETILF